jgi:hypothetical protein
MLFFGGGNITVRTGQSLDIGFWARVRRVNEQIGKDVEQEILELPGRLYFLEKLRPLSTGQIHSIVRLLDALKSNGSCSRFGLSNLGNVVVIDPEAPFRLKDLRLYVHSFSFRTFGLIPYTVNGDMRFCFSIDHKCMSLTEVETLQREFIALLRNQALQSNDGALREEHHEAKPETVHY